MRTNLLIGILFFGVIACSSSPATHDSAQETQRISKPFFWKLEKNGQASYLLGTYYIGVHLKDLPESVFAHLQELKLLNGTLVTEMDPQEREAGPNPRAFADASYLPTGESLDRKISPQAWAILTEILRDKVPEAKLRQYTPAHALLSLGLRRDYNPKMVAEWKAHKEWGKPQQMTMELLWIGHHEGYRLGYLETYQDVMELEARCDCAKKLEAYLLNPPKADSQLTLGQLVATYRAGTLDEMGRKISGLGLDQTAFIADGQKDLIAKNIDSLHEKGPLFIALDVQFMVGEDSLLKRLKSRGFTITRL